MKVNQVLGADYGPGDWQTSPGAFRQAQLMSGKRRPRFREPDDEDPRRAEMDIEDRMNQRRASAQRAKLSDEQYIQSKTTPPATTYTAIAVDEESAKRRVNQLRQTAWQFQGATIKPMSDGRFTVKVEYVQ